MRLYMATELYHDRYRVASARLRGYDYGQNGAYFVTICTQHRTRYFGAWYPTITGTGPTCTPRPWPR